MYNKMSRKAVSYRRLRESRIKRSEEGILCVNPFITKGLE